MAVCTHAACHGYDVTVETQLHIATCSSCRWEMKGSRRATLGEAKKHIEEWYYHRVRHESIVLLASKKEHSAKFAEACIAKFRAGQPAQAAEKEEK